MDSYIKLKCTGCEIYIYDKFLNRWSIRFLGATRGHIEVDENEIILKIKLYNDECHTDKIYTTEVRSCFSKYIGMKLIFID